MHFRDLGEEGLEYLAEARETNGLPIVAEIMSQVQVDLMVKYVDVLQVGARNMQNFNLLRAIGETRTSGSAQARTLRHHRRIAHVC